MTVTISLTVGFPEGSQYLLGVGYRCFSLSELAVLFFLAVSILSGSGDSYMVPALFITLVANPVYTCDHSVQRFIIGLNKARQDCDREILSCWCVNLWLNQADIVPLGSDAFL